MFKSLAGRARTVATTGLIAALVVAGLAVAQGGSNGGGRSQHRKAHSGKRMPPPPGGPMGKFGKDLTYGRLHVQREGRAETIRIDAGEVVSAGDSSITVKENDGNEVTISVDGETKLLAGPGKETAVADLKEGTHVVVCGPEGEAAKTVMVPPKPGQMPPRGHSGGPQGGPEGGPPQMQG